MMSYEISKQWHERACRTIPGGINSNVRAISEPVPLYYTHGKDAHIWDADGNEYIDYVLGQGPMLLGHTPRTVLDAVHEQLEKGMVYAGQTTLEVRAAELLSRHIPCAEMVRFNVTGSEAVHAALRLARAATGRKKILRFEGHYHGWLDTIAWNPFRPGADVGNPEIPLLRPSSLGQCPEDALNLLVAPWNNLDILKKRFAAHGAKLAGVICDPFACACGLIPADKAFLEELRALCTQHGVVLIFDEVITGLRVLPGSAQQYYGVTPDLATFAKALGAGIAVAAVAGKRDLMKLFGEGPTVHAGTYNANPLAMAATVAALEYIFYDDAAALRRAAEAGETLMRGLAERAQGAGIPMELRGLPTVFSTTFPLEAGQPPARDMRDALARYDRDRLRRFWLEMQHGGVHTTCFGIWFLSTCHTGRDIETTLDAAERAFRILAS